MESVSGPRTSPDEPVAEEQRDGGRADERQGLHAPARENPGLHDAALGHTSSPPGATAVPATCQAKWDSTSRCQRSSCSTSCVIGDSTRYSSPAAASSWMRARMRRGLPRR